MALSAQITISLPFVPITGQTLGLTIIALSMGSRLATASITLYIVEGILGLPVFAQASFGITTLLGSSGGYLWGFIPATYVMGLFADQGARDSFLKSSIAVFLGTVILFACGQIQLSFFVPQEQLLSIGLFPFILGGIIKGLLAILIIPSFSKLK